jgi:alpha-L-arabinofuranosidase
MTMKARVTAHADFTIGPVDDRLFSGFLEHLGRAIYSGIWEPGHPSADPAGFRRDVVDLLRPLRLPFVRYPGGNFVSAYDWEDGIGPRDQRPVRLDLAWHTAESNAVGLHEFADWCDLIGTKPMLAVNLGSRGLDAARNLLEYANAPRGSHWGDLRARNGRADPFDVRMWCLGNEMDGPWQVGHKTADEYGRLAGETAKMMRAFDRSLELVVCGSSNADMPTFPDWERVVLEHTYDSIDHISLHMYFANRTGHTGNYLALSAKLDRYIATVAGTIAQVKARKRSKRDVTISFDEWNVWYHSNAADRAILDGRQGWPHAPRLLEDIYTFQDALQVALILNTFLRRADVVKIAAIAQLVNVIAPVMTEPGGPAWVQTIYWPFLFASQYGRGTALQLAVDVAGYDSDHGDDIPFLDIAGVQGDGVTLFLVNRHEREVLEVAIDLLGFGVTRLLDQQVLESADQGAVNDLGGQDRVRPVQRADAVLEGGRLQVRMAPLSYQMVRLG